MRDNHVTFAASCRSQKTLITRAIRFITRARPVAELIDDLEPLASTELSALTKLIVNGFLALLIRRHTWI
jgi:hypothetical protein